MFHAGTSSNAAGEVVATGGRVLAVTATSADVKDAQRKAYQVGLTFKTHQNPCIEAMFQEEVDGASTAARAIDEFIVNTYAGCGHHRLA